jgi:hypothetical protein
MRLRAGDALTAVLYWQALQPLKKNYSVFLHLDAPNGQTYAGVDETNPEDIPTSTWPPALYLRNPLTLASPEGAPAIRYALTAGLYDSKTGERLPAAECDSCPSLPLAHVWLLSPVPFDESRIAHRLAYRLGETISLLGYGLVPGEPAQLTLYWRAEAMQGAGYTVFVHALDGNGAIVAQFDSLPLGGLYPTDAWLPGQIVADLHTIRLPGETKSLAVGLYDPRTMARLNVTDSAGHPVPDNAIILPVNHEE